MIRTARKKLLIVAVDPGTTIGIAMLDLNGNIVKVTSSKNLNIDDVVKTIREYGIPIVLTNDKSYLPTYLEKIRSAYNLKAILPKKDLLLKVKTDLLKWYGAKYLEGGKDINSLLENSHEKDSLASAIFTYKKLFSTIKKIEYFLENNGFFNSGNDKKDFENKNFLRKEVLQNDKSIFSVYENMLKEDSEEVHIIKKKRVKKDLKQDTKEEKKKTTEDILREHISKLKLKIGIHKKERKSFRNMISKIMAKESYKEKSDRRLSVKNREINKHKKEIDRLKDYLYVEKKRKESFYNIFSRIEDYYVVWVVDKITENSLDEFFKKSKSGDLIYIKDVDRFSPSAIKKLKNKTKIIIVDKVNKRVGDDFVLVLSEKLNLKRVFDKFAVVKKSVFEKERRSKDILNKIIKDYKEERGN